MDTELSSSAMQRLLGVNKVALNDLAKRGIVKRGRKNGTYVLESSVRAYCKHLRSMAAGRGGEAAASARERLGQTQAALAEVKAQQLAGELIKASEVEKVWTSKLRSFRNRILAIPHRVEYLSARQTMVLTQELRSALDELADDAA